MYTGAGKTTTLRMILGLVVPTAGTATIGGARYAGLDQPIRRVGALLEAGAAHKDRTGRNHLRIVCQAAGLPLAGGRGPAAHRPRRGRRPHVQGLFAWHAAAPRRRSGAAPRRNRVHPLAFVIWAVFGLGPGTLIRNQAVSVVTGLSVYLGGFAAVELIFHAVYYFYRQDRVLGAPVIAPARSGLTP